MRTLILVTLFAVGCASSNWVRSDVMFGRCKPKPPGAKECPLVTPEEWQKFVDTEVEPRFPDGFTVLEGAGEWRNVSAVVHEPSKVLTILHPRDGKTSALIDEIRAAYKKQFQQDAVLRADTDVTVRFN